MIDTTSPPSDIYPELGPLTQPNKAACHRVLGTSSTALDPVHQSCSSLLLLAHRLAQPGSISKDKRARNEGTKDGIGKKD